jgi:hypothetical protein
MIERFGAAGFNEGRNVRSHKKKVEAKRASRVGCWLGVKSEGCAVHVDKVVLGDDSGCASHVGAKVFIKVAAKDELMTGLEFRS